MEKTNDIKIRHETYKWLELDYENLCKGLPRKDKRVRWIQDRINLLHVWEACIKECFNGKKKPFYEVKGKMQVRLINDLCPNNKNHSNKKAPPNMATVQNSNHMLGQNKNINNGVIQNPPSLCATCAIHRAEHGMRDKIIRELQDKLASQQGEKKKLQDELAKEQVEKKELQGKIKELQYKTEKQQVQMKKLNDERKEATARRKVEQDKSWWKKVFGL